MTNRTRCLAVVASTLWLLQMLPASQLTGHPAVAKAKDKKARTQERDSAEACTPGYDPCIPPGPDVDCAGGSGNGPRYVEGPVTVTGSDPYGLDRDGDGVGCE
jgi:hypothetical protein